MALHTFRRLLVVVALACLAWPAQALAVPPLNDSYLQSIPVNKKGEAIPEQIEVKDLKDTLEATVQTDLFTPPATGGGLERTDCRGTTFGKTVWYDLHPTVNGGVRIQAAGFDAAIGVYEFNPSTSMIVSRVDCANDPGGLSEELQVEVKAGKSYTIQIGGSNTPAGAAGGMLQFTFEFFGDRDADSVFDALDKCPTQPGTQDGCPRELRSLATLKAAPTGAGLKVVSLRVEAPKGAKVRARCKRGCSFSQTKTSRGVVGFGDLRGRSLRVGALLETFVTQPKTIGVYTSWRITRGGFKRTNRCLQPGKMTPSKCP